MSISLKRWSRDDPEQGKLWIGLPTTSGKSEDPYAQENQAILQRSGAAKAWVERDQQGLLVSLVVEYPNGESELLFHNDISQPTTQSFVTQSPETPSPDAASQSPTSLG